MGTEVQRASTDSKSIGFLHSNTLRVDVNELPACGVLVSAWAHKSSGQ